MTPEEQARLQKRMQEWAALTPDQRRAAREKYREFEQLPTKERQVILEKWDQYKQELAQKPAAAPAQESNPPADSAAAESTQPAPGLPPQADTQPVAATPPLSSRRDCGRGADAAAAASLVRRLAAMVYEALVVAAVLLIANFPFAGASTARLEGLSRHLFQAYLFLVLGAATSSGAGAAADRRCR